MTSVDYFWTFPEKVNGPRQFFHNLAGILIVNASWHDSNDLFTGAGLRREINAASDPHLSICLFHCQMKISGRWVADLWYLLQALYLVWGILYVSAPNSFWTRSLLIRDPLWRRPQSWSMLPNISIHRPISSSLVWFASRVPHHNVMTARVSGRTHGSSHIRWKW